VVRQRVLVERRTVAKHARCGQRYICLNADFKERLWQSPQLEAPADGFI
jgi:hypothetical protein